MKTKEVTIEGKKFFAPVDAIYYFKGKVSITFYKIEKDKVLCVHQRWDIDVLKTNKTGWQPCVSATPEDITDKAQFKLMPGLSSKKTLGEKLTTSWEEHPVHKEDQSKIPVHYCPPAAVEGIGQVLYNSTAIKNREPWNWREGEIDLMGYIGKTMRHIHATVDRRDKDDLDPEIKTHHLDCALANLALIRDAMKHGTLVDNRPVSNR